MFYYEPLWTIMNHYEPSFLKGTPILEKTFICFLLSNDSSMCSLSSLTNVVQARLHILLPDLIVLLPDVFEPWYFGPALSEKKNESVSWDD